MKTNFVSTCPRCQGSGCLLCDQTGLACNYSPDETNQFKAICFSVILLILVGLTYSHWRLLAQ